MNKALDEWNHEVAMLVKPHVFGFDVDLRDEKHGIRFDPRADFGLRREVHGLNSEVGGYLCRRKKKSAWQSATYFRISDADRALIQVNKKDHLSELSIAFAKIISVKLLAEELANPEEEGEEEKQKKATRDSFFLYMRVELRRGGEDELWDLRASNLNDKNYIVSWVAALQLRCKCYDSRIDEEKERMVKCVLAIQSAFRGRIEREKFALLKRKKQPSSSTLSLAKQDGFFRLVSSFFTRDDYRDNTKEVPKVEEDEEEEDAQESVFQAKRKEKRTSTFFRKDEKKQDLRDALRKEPKSEKVIIDEVWENQRWSAIERGWSTFSLLPTDARGHFSDVSGKVKFHSLDEIKLPLGWTLLSPWEIDRKGERENKCNKDGWMFQTNFAALETDFASGNIKTYPSARWLVRRRKWVRERKKEKEADPCSDTPPSGLIHIFGWLGIRGVSKFRWKERFCACVNTDRGRAFIYFRDSFKTHGSDCSLSFDWTKLTTKECKMFFLDNRCRVFDKATAVDPGVFSLHLTGEGEPRFLNAHTGGRRVEWLQTLKDCIRQAGDPSFETMGDRRSMRKGAAWEIYNASSKIKQAFVGRQLATLEKESSSDLLEIEQLRNRRRREEAAAPQVDERDGFINKVRSSFRIVTKRERGESDRDSQVELTPRRETKKSFSPGSPPLSPVQQVKQEEEEPLEQDDKHFVVPVPFDNVVFDGCFDVSVDAMEEILFSSEDFHRDLFAEERFQEVVIEQWTDGSKEGSENRRSMKRPRVGIVPPTTAHHLLTRRQSVPGQGYVVEQITETPDVPYGSYFSCDLQTVLIGESACRTRIRVTQKITFRRQTMAAAFVKNGTFRELSGYFKNFWGDYLNRWIRTKKSFLLFKNNMVNVPAELVEQKSEGKIFTAKETKEGLFEIVEDKSLENSLLRLKVAVGLLLLLNALLFLLCAYLYRLLLLTKQVASDL